MKTHLKTGRVTDNTCERHKRSIPCLCMYTYIQTYIFIFYIYERRGYQAHWNHFLVPNITQEAPNNFINKKFAIRPLHISAVCDDYERRCGFFRTIYLKQKEKKNTFLVDMRLGNIIATLYTRPHPDNKNKKSSNILSLDKVGEGKNEYYRVTQGLLSGEGGLGVVEVWRGGGWAILTNQNQCEIDLVCVTLSATVKNLCLLRLLICYSFPVFLSLSLLTCLASPRTRGTLPGPDGAGCDSG